MNILAVDDESWGLAVLSTAIQKAVPNETLQSFDDSLEALEYAKGHVFDVAFLDVKMPEMDGLALAAELKRLYPKINIIFVTGYSEYTGAAFALHASGYVNKPVSPGAVLEQLENLRFKPAELSRAAEWTLGPYRINTITQCVFLNERDTQLKPREFSLFLFLAENIEEFFAPETLYQQAWGDDLNRSSIHTLYVRLSNLRKKLELNDQSAYTIEHTRPKGYRLTKRNTNV